MARWASAQGAEVTVSEIRDEAALDREILKKALGLGVGLETGGHRTETFMNSDMVIVSPGVPLDIEPLKAAGNGGITVVGDLELASRMIPVPIIAITGTNGKSTATKLIGHMIERAGHNAFVGGNIGTPLIDYMMEKREADFAVVEVSSFQLDASRDFCPHISVILNISPDHLDRYPDYDAYVQSKLMIYRNQGPGSYLILNDGDEKLSRVDPPRGVHILRYGMEGRENRQAYLESGELKAFFPRSRMCTFKTERFGLPGRHNLENLMATVLVGLALSLEAEGIQDAIDRFQGLAHRLERVGTVKGVTFYNDSKATNVDAALRAILSLDNPVILIAGGRHKGADYAPLVRAAGGKVRSAVFLGEARHLLAKTFQGILPFSMADSMEDAVARAFASARSSDVVLLAPACSSFDMFNDYAHRGRVFMEAVKRLNHDG